MVLGVLAADGFGQCSLPLSSLLRKLEAVLGRCDLQPQSPQRALPTQPPILRRLHLVPARCELSLSRGGELARLGEPPLERQRLGRRAPVRVTRFAPLLPHDAASEKLEPRIGFGGLASRSRLGADDLQSGLDLGLQVFEAQQILGQLRQALPSLLPPCFDTANLCGLFEKLAALGRRAHHDALDVVLVDDRVRIDGEAG